MPRRAKRSPAGAAPERAVREAARTALSLLADAPAARVLVLRLAFVALAERSGHHVRLDEVPIGSLDGDALDDDAAARIAATLADAFAMDGAAEPEMLGAAYEGVSGEPGRRRIGAYFTPRRLCNAAVRRALEPLLARTRSRGELLSLRVCDPAMGCGAFLLEVCRRMSGLGLAGGREIAAACLFGVDRDPTAVELARLSLWLLVASPGDAIDLDVPGLACGDSLVGAGSADLDPRPTTVRALDAWIAPSFWPEDASIDPPEPDAFDRYLEIVTSDEGHPWTRTVRAIATERRLLHWELAFPRVFSRERPGFDAVVGNPPWIAYAGRAAQPIEPAMFRWFLRRSPAFAGYRSLHGVFVHRAASILRIGGRLGLVVPTSVSDLAGYAPARRAHDDLCEAEADLDDFGARAFDDVFQPAMALVSTRVEGRVGTARPETWSLARSDLDGVGRALLERLAAMPVVDPSLFGERGFQSLSTDAPHILRTATPTGRHTVPIREGSDIGEFVLSPARHHIDPVAVGRRLRADDAWRGVAVLIRQTARWPIVAPSDGLAFRNSILAGFARDDWTAPALAAFLSSSVVRWLHYVRFRDARQGMPQVKISHLRSLPDPGPRRGRLVDLLTRAGARSFAARSGLGAEDRAAIDGAVADAFDLSQEERACVRAWAGTPIR